MTKKFLLLTTILSCYSGSCFAEAVNNSEICKSLGYTFTYDECITKNTVPLLCPFADAINKQALCVTNSCRGYPLKETDFNQIASDGKSILYHIKDPDNSDPNAPAVFVPKQKDSHGILGCLAAYEKASDGTINEVWYYKIKECKAGSMYQNNLCDKGCDRANKYPYDTHPGNFAGKVENCVDEKGESFGYVECNEGWKFNKGQCLLNQCSISNYPYSSDPNAVVNRGLTTTCQIGKNLYYRYSETAPDGSSSEEICSGKGYTYLNGLCLESCNLTNCTPTNQTVTYTLGGKTYTRTYHEWSCKKSTSYCREGDYAVVNGVIIGSIAHMPDAEYNKMLIVNPNVNVGQKWGDGNATTIDTPLPNLSVAAAKQDYNGRLNSNTILNFKETDNTNLKYPAFEYVAAYSSPSCAHDVCKAGEWYVPSLGELGYLYDYRYILYKTTKFKQDITWSSNEASASSAWRLRPDVGIRDGVTKEEGRLAIPVISIIIK